MRRKKAEGRDAPGLGDGKVTPSDIQQVEFRLAFRGYNERDVDAFLDRVTEDLAGYLEENRRLRAGSDAAVVVPAAAEDEARREAAEIVARAREEAAEIVREAEQRAAAAGVEAQAARGDARGAVGPFLNREREFLQSLGSLVQGHAEEIKQMVVTLRARSDAMHRPQENDGATEAATASEIREGLGEPEPEPDPVIVETGTEPAYSSEGAPAGEGRERSLRELFWGED